LIHLIWKITLLCRSRLCWRVKLLTVGWRLVSVILGRLLLAELVLLFLLLLFVLAFLFGWLCCLVCGQHRLISCKCLGLKYWRVDVEFGFDQFHLFLDLWRHLRVQRRVDELGLEILGWLK